MKTIKLTALASAIIAATTVAPVSFAADAAIEEVTVLGSRGAPRTVSDSPVPVDVISAADMSKTGSNDMLELLKGTVPAFNVHDNPISDAASMIRPANLRGLSADSTLILVNGKRRHRSSVIAFQGAGINDGAQGPDISVIPGIALKQVEILRDGAAAQYGSDAIAGVMNFVLKDDAEGGSLSVKTGEFYEGDGAATIYDGNIGLPLTDAGFVNISFQYKNQDDTSRSVQRDDAQALIDAGNTDVPVPAMIWGMPKVDDDITIFVNTGLDLGNGAEAYAFGNYSERDIDGGFYYRNPNNRGGVFTSDGERLIGDFSGEDGYCADIYADGVGSIQDDASDLTGIIADANCWVVNEMYPGGYTPRFTGNIVDTSLTAGTRGMKNDINYDVSFSVGRSESDFGLNNTLNPSLGPDSPQNFRTGSYIQLEKSMNIDLQKQIGNTSVAGGYEWREESFEIIAGEQASWEQGPLAEQGFNVGSHGFPGFTASSAGSFDRRNYAVYVDVESQLSNELLVGGALRYEDFSSFGSTTNYKLTAHYTINDMVAVRASHSTGFRAPTMGQANVVNTQTTFNETAELIQVQTLPAEFLGGEVLQPEESTNWAVGLILTTDFADVTVDAYKIEVTDRVALTPPQEITAAQMTALENANIPVPDMVNFFANDFDTETTGLDIVATTDAALFNGSTLFSVAYNYNKTEVSDPGVLTSDFKIRRLEEALPNHRATFTMSQNWDNVSAFVRANYYGEYYAVHADSSGDGFDKDAGSAVTFDAEASYMINSNFTVTAGAQNIFDQDAEELPADVSAGVGGMYYETSPFGINGGFYYLKGTYNF
ncbi:TonB-dependent receptor [Gammaproteobacteria bacterium LSUCC0057]|uniref:TonB-dependent receptor n=1 Tax=Gammaproteobacteria bacterium LSUCC0057 TaxID=2559237 RepID=A0A4Y8UH81_9GAMM|nr:TonB-dependent receptor [Gammaproteobacteria bacterium LSUCC0057]